MCRITTASQPNAASQARQLLQEIAFLGYLASALNIV